MLKLRDIMTREVLTLSPETTLRDAVAALAAHHMSGAPVVTGARVVGVVSMTDLLDFEASTLPVPGERTEQAEFGAALEEAPEWEGENEPPGTFFTELWTDVGADVSERFATERSAEWDLLGEHTVSEVMNRRVHAMSPDASVDAAADEMRRAGIHRILVMDGTSLLGIVTTADITRAVADHELVVRRYVFDRRGGEEDRESGF